MSAFPAASSIVKNELRDESPCRLNKLIPPVVEYTLKTEALALVGVITCSRDVGTAVPIPTFPASSIVIRSVKTEGAALVPVQKDNCPGTLLSAIVPEDIPLIAAPAI